MKVIKARSKAPHPRHCSLCSSNQYVTYSLSRNERDCVKKSENFRLGKLAPGQLTVSEGVWGKPFSTAPSHRGFLLIKGTHRSVASGSPEPEPELDTVLRLRAGYQLSADGGQAAGQDHHRLPSVQPRPFEPCTSSPPVLKVK